MKPTYHYMLMTNHMLLQKKLLTDLKETELTAGQPKVLDYLQDHNGASQKELAEGCRIEPGFSDFYLKPHGRKGNGRAPDAGGNRRTYYIFLTEKGEKLLGIIQDKFKKLEETAFRGFSAEDRQQFMELFFHIYKNMTEEEA